MARVHLCLAIILAALCTASAVRVPYHRNMPTHELIAPKGDAMLCELCDYASNFAEHYLEKNGTEDKVTDFVVNDVCPKLPESISGSCTSYAPMLISYAFQKAEAELSSGALCKPLCGDNRMAPSLESNGTCSFCEKAAVKVHDFLSQPGEIDKIVSFVKEVCAVLPDKEHDKCVSTITGFGPMALNYVIGLTSDPQNACSMIDMCP